MLGGEPATMAVLGIAASHNPHLGGGLVLHAVDAGEAALPDQRVDADGVRAHLGYTSHCASG